MLRYQDKTATAVLDLDLRRFDVDEKQKDEQVRRYRERSVKFRDPNAIASKRGNWFFWTILAACVLAAVVFYVSGKIELSEINSLSLAAEAEFEEAKRENVRLKTSLESMATPAKVEEYAANAGLIKEQVSQVTRISLNADSAIEVAQTRDDDLLRRIDGWFSNILEFLGFQ
jgi:cell division protein FtsL